MKALKSDLARQILADPAAKSKFRQFIVNNWSPSSAVWDGRQPLEITVTTNTGQKTVQPVLVPKAS
jgi:hypothetical protein